MRFLGTGCLVLRQISCSGFQWPNRTPREGPGLFLSYIPSYFGQIPSLSGTQKRPKPRNWSTGVEKTSPATLPGGIDLQTGPRVASWKADRPFV